MQNQHQQQHHHQHLLPQSHSGLSGHPGSHSLSHSMVGMRTGSGGYDESQMSDTSEELGHFEFSHSPGDGKFCVCVCAFINF